MFMRPDNGLELVATMLRKWFGRLGVKTLFITPGSPWENGCCENFNGRLRDEILNSELLYSLLEAQVVIETWRRGYNTISPHSLLDTSLQRRRPSCRSIQSALLDGFGRIGLISEDPKQ